MREPTKCAKRCSATTTNYDKICSKGSFDLVDIGYLFVPVAMNPSTDAELTTSCMDEDSSTSCSDSTDSDNEESISSSESSSDEENENVVDSIKTVREDDVMGELAVAGPVGVAAASAITSVKSYKKSYSFQTNAVIRRRQRTRLVNKLQILLDEYSARVGQQAVVVIATPGNPKDYYKVIGAQPLQKVMKNVRSIVMEEFERSLALQTPALTIDDSSRFLLPPLIIDGIPTPVEHMTQANLRSFIPFMLKYALGRSQPGWGNESVRPPWWPTELPWANVRTDPRNKLQKLKMSWTAVLKDVVIRCYKHHNREDLLDLCSINSDISEIVDDPPPVLDETDQSEDVQDNVQCFDCLAQIYTTEEIIVTSKSGLHITEDGTILLVQPVLEHVSNT